MQVEEPLGYPVRASVQGVTRRLCQEQTIDGLLSAHLATTSWAERQMKTFRNAFTRTDDQATERGRRYVRPPGDDFFFMHDLNTDLLLDGKAELEDGSAIVVYGDYNIETVARVDFRTG